MPVDDDKVEHINSTKYAYPLEQELHKRFMDVIYEYHGRLSVASAIGVLSLTIDKVKEDSK